MLERVFESHFTSFSCLFTLGLNGRSIYAPVFFFIALTKVLFAVLLALNLPQRGFPGTCRLRDTVVFAARCYLGEILHDPPTVNIISPRMNKISPVGGKPVLTSCVAWKPKMDHDFMLNSVFQSCLWSVVR